MLHTVQGTEDPMVTMAFVVPALMGLSVQGASLEASGAFLLSLLRLRALLTRPKSSHAGSLERYLFTSLCKIYLASFYSLDLP